MQNFKNSSVFRLGLTLMITLIISQLMYMSVAAFWPDEQSSTPLTNQATTLSLPPQSIQPTSPTFLPSYLITSTLYLPYIFAPELILTVSSQLETPVLISPTSGSYHEQTTFDWEDVADVPLYHFQLSDTADFGTLIVDEIVNQSGYTLADTLTGTFYWRVFSREGSNRSDYSETRTVYLLSLDSPTLITPADGGLVGLPTFDWMDVTSATTYLLEIAPTNAFSTTIYSTTTTVSTANYTHNLTGDFYWRVQASLDEVVSPYSEVRSVQLLTLGSPTLLTPGEGEKIGTPNFSWTSVENATSYQLDLSLSSEFGVIDYSEVTTDTTLTYTGDLTGTYSWRVQAQNGDIVGPYSESRSLELAALDAPMLISPENGAAQAQPTFDWDDVTEATSYQIQIADAADFSTPLINQSVISSAFSFSSIQLGTFYWRVYALKDGQAGPMSETRTVELVDYNGDADGDSLPNGWELHGFDYDDDGILDVDLPALGANYLHKDLFVEMDYMVHPNNSVQLAPNQTVMDRIVEVFANIPISNPDGIDGIKIHLDLDDEVPYDDNISWGTNGDLPEFFALKDAYFEPERIPVYHYMIWANRYANHGSTKPFATGVSPRVPGTEFLVTLGNFNGGTGGTNDEKVSTFVHELGHNLGLAHGGGNAKNYKPNYFSQMNYWWSLSGVDVDGEDVIGYQTFELPSLNESNLNEAAGLRDNNNVLTGYTTFYYCPNRSIRSVAADGPIDWNCDGDTNDTGVSSDINDDDTIGSLSSENDLDNLDFTGASSKQIIGKHP